MLRERFTSLVLKLKAQHDSGKSFAVVSPHSIFLSGNRVEVDPVVEVSMWDSPYVDQKPGIYTKENDIYGLGLTLYSMCSGHVLQEGESVPFTPFCDIPEVNQVIRNLMQPDVASRVAAFTALSALTDPIFSDQLWKAWGNTKPYGL